jgi:hypothetical protein
LVSHFYDVAYLPGMRKSPFDPCIPTRGTTVPAGKDWIHEIKHDGYRLIIQRDGRRVRLFTRNGHDWSDRFPLITEAALRNRNSSFVIDGEAVLLGVDGRSDFNGLHSQSNAPPSAPADPINRTATIHRCSWPYSDSSGTDAGGHRGSCDRPRHQPDAGSYDATGRITYVLAVDHGTGRFTACDHESGDQQR